MKRDHILLTLGLISLAIFVIPDILSMFVGQHSFYDKANCQRCHVAEYEEVWAASTTKDAHIAAANNTNYTTYLAIGGIDYVQNGTIYTVDNKTWAWNASSRLWDNVSSILVRLDTNNNSGIDGIELCHLCHNSTLTGKQGSHAITVRTCDDDWCHGNRNNSFNDPELFNNSQNTTVNVGMALNDLENIHRTFYLSQSNEPTGYMAIEPFNHTIGNIAGDYISKGYWTCVGCHSQVQIEINIASNRPFNHTDGSRRKYI